MYLRELFLRQDNSCFGEGAPIQALSAAVTVGLVLPFHGPSALRTNGKTSYARGEEVSGTKVTSFRGSFVAEFLRIAQSEDRGG